MLQDSFSAGKWLVGFAPLADTFPFYPDLTAGAGAGEAPVLVYEKCLIDTGASGGELGSGEEDPTCRALAQRAGETLAMFLDNHGEPLTPGRFPRYVPHERQAWVGTVTTKYTSSSAAGTFNLDTNGDSITDAEGSKINQVMTSTHKIVSDKIVTWFSMSDASGQGCPGGWCQWLWNPTDPQPDFRLRVAYTNPNNPAWTVSGGSVITFLPPSATATNVTEFTVVNEVTGDYITRALTNFEKAPSEIYQIIGQSLQFLGGTATGAVLSNGVFIDGVGADNFWQEFWGFSGPNVMAHEGINPYTWLTCGTNSVDFDCQGTAGPGDAPLGATMAITQFGVDPTNRFGPDFAPSSDPTTDFGMFDTDNDGYGDVDASTVADCTAYGGAGSACDQGLRTAMVACVAGGDADNDPTTSDCLSTAGGGDGIYGNGPGDILYYKEVVEEGLRGAGLRHDRAYAFSFLNGLGANTGNVGSGLNNSLRQLVTSAHGGFGLSCLNCENDPTHRLPAHNLNYAFSYNQTFTGFVDVHPPPLPIQGIITFSAGGP
jgi:hypothetical protein